jgi:drug/metabolite transporter (DMT)-like permease
MSALALSLVLVAALLHAGWNLLLKQAADRLVVIWWALIAGAVLFLPVLVRAPVPRAIWPFLVASALVECGYYLCLSYAYAQADFSQVYPLARGAAPALLTLWAALALREHPSPAGYGGLALIVGGLVPVGSGGTSWWRWRGSAFRARGVAAALGMALCTSVYSLIDGAAVRRTDAAPYTVAVILLTAAFLAPLVLRRHGGRMAGAVLRFEWRRVIVAGAMTLLAYGLVLHAYAIARLAYAGAVREVSVVIVALVGWLWLGEAFGPRRLAGAVAVFSGILVLAILG